MYIFLLIISLNFSQTYKYSPPIFKFGIDNIKDIINNDTCYQDYKHFIACYFAINELSYFISDFVLIPKKGYKSFFNKLFKNKKFYNYKFINSYNNYFYITNISNYEKLFNNEDEIKKLVDSLKTIFEKEYYNYFINNEPVPKDKFILNFNKFIRSRLENLNYLNNNIKIIKSVLLNISFLLSAVQKSIDNISIENLNNLKNIKYFDFNRYDFGSSIAKYFVNKFLTILDPANALLEKRYDEDNSNININEAYLEYQPGFNLEFINFNNKSAFIITDINYNSDAYLKGLRKGDIITEVLINLNNNEKRYIQFSELNNLNNFIHRPKGEEIWFKIADVLYPIRVKCDTLVKNIEHFLIDYGDNFKKYYYIKINYFAEYSNNNFTGTFFDIINKININSPRGIVIDLRSNFGGFLDLATKFLDLFTKKDTVLYIQSKDTGEEFLYKFGVDNISSKNEIRAQTDLKIDLPIIILTNQMTISSAELVAGSLKELLGAIIVGESEYTFGKGSIIEIFDYPNYDKIINYVNGNLKLPVSAKTYHYQGIKSDLVIKCKDCINRMYNFNMKNSDFIFRNLNIKKERKNKVDSYTYNKNDLNNYDEKITIKAYINKKDKLSYKKITRNDDFILNFVINNFDKIIKKYK